MPALGRGTDTCNTSSSGLRRTPPYQTASYPSPRISDLPFPASASFAAPLGPLRCFEPCPPDPHLDVVPNAPWCPLPACFASTAFPTRSGPWPGEFRRWVGPLFSSFFASPCVLVCGRRDLRLGFRVPHGGAARLRPPLLDDSGPPLVITGFLTHLVGIRAGRDWDSD